MRKLFAALLLAIGFATAAPAWASDQAYQDCMDKAVTNPDFAVCGNALIERRDAELNKVWKETNKDLDPQVKKALLDEQRLWVAFKDKSCLTWVTGFYGREGQVVHFYTCRADIIDQRIEYLSNLGDTGEPEEGDTPEDKPASQ